MQKKIVIAIDGFSSCGKSTMAKELAKKIGYIYIDSGAMYRAITLYCINKKLISGNQINEEALQKEIDHIEIKFRLNADTKSPETYLNGINVETEIRSMEVSDKVSYISALPFVRQAMVMQQQEIGKSKGIVMDGRDIGTTVFPNAELKIFVTASPETRTERRMKELQQKGSNASYEEVLENIKKRDYIDQNRAESPLKMAEDALLLDNSELTIGQQDEWLINRYNDVIQSI